MTKTITLKIWDEDEGKVTKKVEIDNVLSVSFEVNYNEITFVGGKTEIFIIPKLNDIKLEFSEDKEYVFITVKECEQ